jgi:Arc/MetJ-type ribon-helix-helix transcriptional regulator
MHEIQINMPADLEQFAHSQVASGRFASINDYVVSLVSADEETQEVLEKLTDNPELAALLEHGLNSGEGRHWSPAVLQQLKQQVLDRAAEQQT